MILGAQSSTLNKKQSMDSSQTAWVWIPALLLTTCDIVGEVYNHSVPPFVHLQYKSYPVEVMSGLHVMDLHIEANVLVLLIIFIIL